MKQIVDKTPIYTGYELNEKGYAVIPKRNNDLDPDKNGCLIFYEKNAIDYGGGILGLYDSTLLSPEDFTVLHNGIFIKYNDGTLKFHNVISGSEGATIDGTNPYMTADYLSRRKRGLVETVLSAETEFKFGCGHAIEEMILNGFYELESRKYQEKKFEVYTDHTIFFDTVSGCLMANVDAFADTDEGTYIVEAKSTSNMTGWADKDVPENYKTQAIKHYPLVLGRCKKIIGTYFAGMFEFKLSSLMIRKYERIEVLEEIYMDKVKLFINYLESKEEIPYGIFDDDADAVAAELDLQYPLATDKQVMEIEDDEIIKAITSYLDIHKRKTAAEKLGRELEAEEKPFKNIIRKHLGKKEKAKVTVDGIEYEVNLSNNNPRISITSKKLKELQEVLPGIYEKLELEGYINYSQPRKFEIKEPKKPKKKAKKAGGVSE